MALTTITVTGSWVGPDGQPSAGQIVVTPVAEATGGGFIVVARPQIASLVNGSISMTLVGNAQATSLQYQVTEQITGAPTVGYVITPTGSTVDLSTAPRSTSGPVATFVTAGSLGAANGVATLDSGGHVPASQLPPESGNEVTSVTAADTTVTVAGTASAPTVAVNTATLDGRYAPASATNRAAVFALVLGS